VVSSLLTISITYRISHTTEVAYPSTQPTQKGDPLKWLMFRSRISCQPGVEQIGWICSPKYA
jgi:hypothetical protein